MTCPSTSDVNVLTTEEDGLHHCKLALGHPDHHECECHMNWLDATPVCESCSHPLVWVDHYQIEHSILDEDRYRPVGLMDRGPQGEDHPLASEVDLRCGRCGRSLTVDQRRWFYQRWVYIQQYIEAQGRPE
jgi:hypothetical protein